jgi:hypothetical protein
MQLVTDELAPAAVLTVTAATRPAPGPSAPVIPTTPTTIAPTSGVVVGQLSTTDRQQLVTAFDQWEELPSTCDGQMISGSSKEATITASQVSWAIASFRPVSNCTAFLNPASSGPFGEHSPPVGVFERMKGGAWVMNSEGGTPFPCPAADGQAPAVGNGSLPPSVVAAWKMTYAPNCASVIYLRQPGE